MQHIQGFFPRVLAISLLAIIALTCKGPTSPDVPPAVYNNPYDERGGSYIPTPDINTAPVTAVRAMEARSGGQFETNYGRPVTRKGVCWSTSENPTILDDCSNDGQGHAAFESTMQGLQPGETYFVRAYATNSAATIYGGQRVFTTMEGIPEMVTDPAREVGPNSARLLGEVRDDGGADLGGWGICYSQQPDPDLSDSCHDMAAEPAENRKNPDSGILSGLSAHSAFRSSGKNAVSRGIASNSEDGVRLINIQVTGLEPGRTYYARTFAVNDVGSSFGPQVEFTTLSLDAPGIPGKGVTDSDGNEYRTVIIGRQEWMAENLRVTRYRNGEPLPSDLNGNQWESASTGASAIYNPAQIDGLSSPEQVAQAYGLLYNWHAVHDQRGLCPAGWIVPADEDWEELENLVSAMGYPDDNVTGGLGNALKSRRQVDSPFGAQWATTTHPRWDSDMTHHGWDVAGWDALPGGMRSTNGPFEGAGSRGFWWSSTESGNDWARIRGLDVESGGTIEGAENKRNGFSVRCVFDGEISVTVPEVTTLMIEDITDISARTGGDVISDGGTDVTSRGVCYAQSPNPDLQTGICMDSGAGTGRFEVVLTDLIPEMTYYVRAYATNVMGTGWGEERSFRTLDPDWNLETEVVDVTSITGRVWMDRNMGAKRAAASSSDEQAYGDLYQWGRAADGHQRRNSPTTSTRSSADQPGHGSFILVTNDPFDWRSPQNDVLWEGINGTNNPCPDGYRLPTEAEWVAERESWAGNNAAGAFASPLKLPAAGYRSGQDGSFAHIGSDGVYWSSSATAGSAWVMAFNNENAGRGINRRAEGRSVRCIKDSDTSTPQTFTLALEASPVDGGTVDGGGSYEEGTEVTIVATPAQGYVFVNWTGDTANVSDMSATATTITMPGSNVTITAHFDPEDDDDWPRDTGTTVIDVTSPTGRVWMDRNLGASRAADSSDDSGAYGDLYQWGRSADGHQLRNSPTTSTLSSTDRPGHGSFITSTSEANWNWRSAPNDNLWQGINGTNNPCPDGYRLPTEAEWIDELESWSSFDSDGAIDSPLRVPMSGGRGSFDGSLFDVGSYGYYWSSTVSGLPRSLSFSLHTAYTDYSYHAYGKSVRCIKN